VAVIAGALGRFSTGGIVMMRKAISRLALAACLLSASVPLLAHHGTAAFDNDKKLTLKATVTEWYWANPHCLLRFDVKGDNGQVVHWIAETQNPVTMVDGGWSKPGDEVTVTLNPVKNGVPLGRIITVLLPDGKTLDATAGIRNYK
jgi:Family of unknown function (DUF6152)